MVYREDRWALHVPNQAFPLGGRNAMRSRENLYERPVYQQSGDEGLQRESWCIVDLTIVKFKGQLDEFLPRVGPINRSLELEAPRDSTKLQL